jgi:Cytochrome c7 and related cytochrome c
MEPAMIRNVLLVSGAIVVVGASFLVTFARSQDKTDEDRAFVLGVPYTSFNWKTVGAQHRGCNACHGNNLAETTNNTTVRRARPELHGIFVVGHDIPLRVEDCQICHSKKKGFPAIPKYANTIHSIHLNSSGFNSMRGNCESCHVSASNFELYDDNTRYEILNGITSIATPEFK